MPRIAAHELTPDQGSMMIYNAMDSLLTYEINDTLRQLPGGNDTLAYDFERALQAPVLEMQLRGFRVDPAARELAIQSARRKLNATQTVIDTLAGAVWDRGLNPNSPIQLKSFFYNHMGIIPITSFSKGERKESMDRKTLEKLENYFYPRPIVNAVLLARDLAKTLQVLETEVDPDWRWRCSYNIAGTESWRFSSSKSGLGTGNNFQNIHSDLRRIFIADPGMKLFGIDKEQAESREVGFLCGVLFDDWTYLNAAESGDLHTSCARLIWPNLPWNGDLKKDRKIADQEFYRGFTYRDMSKRGGHACVTEDHEVLTPEGWVNICEKPSIILEFNAKTGESSFTEVQQWTDTEWTGNFHEWNGQSLSIKMNETHRVYYTTTTERELNVIRAKNVPMSAKIPLGWGYVGGDCGITPEIARLIAAYQCDGYWGEGRAIRFHMHKDRKFHRLNKLALEAGVKYNRNRTDSATIYVEDAIFWPKKAGAYLLTWPADALRAYLSELPHWDGYFGTTYISLSSVDRNHLDWIRTCNRILGTGGNIRKRQKSEFGSECFTLQYNNRKLATLKSIDKKITNETLRVLCPTVEHEAFYIRRNGKISITGNTNYYGKPPTVAMHLKVPVKVITEFQERYFSAFPCIPRMHTWVAQELQTKQCLTNVFGISRDFFDRPDSDETLRSAIAHMFQSATAMDLNLGMWRVWKYMGDRVQLLAQLHDAIYGQFSEDEDERAIVAEIQDHLNVELTHYGRRFIVPTEAKTGYNWSPRYKLDANGNLIDWNPRGLDKVK